MTTLLCDDSSVAFIASLMEGKVPAVMGEITGPEPEVLSGSNTENKTRTSNIKPLVLLFFCWSASSKA